MERDKISESDLQDINAALDNGEDVMIQCTADGGYRIMRSKPRLIKRSRERRTKPHIPDYPKIK